MATLAEHQFLREQVDYLDDHMDKMNGEITKVSSKRILYYHTVDYAKCFPEDSLQELYDLRRWVSHLGAYITTLKGLYRAIEPKHLISYKKYMSCLHDAEHEFRECNVEIEHLQNIQNLAFKC